MMTSQLAGHIRLNAVSVIAWQVQRVYTVCNVSHLAGPCDWYICKDHHVQCMWFLCIEIQLCLDVGMWFWTGVKPAGEHRVQSVAYFFFWWKNNCSGGAHVVLNRSDTSLQLQRILSVMLAICVVPTFSRPLTALIFIDDFVPFTGCYVIPSYV
jgi:hypothetical protein